MLLKNVVRNLKNHMIYCISARDFWIRFEYKINIIMLSEVYELSRNDNLSTSLFISIISMAHISNCFL